MTSSLGQDRLVGIERHPLPGIVGTFSVVGVGTPVVVVDARLVVVVVLDGWDLRGGV